jgi:Spy/CpxP family protein refolding chaperone
MIGWLAGRLDLTDDQKAEIEKMRDADREKVVSLRKELMRAHHDLRGEMMKDDPDAAKARKLTEKIGELRTDMQLLHLEHRLAVRRILTPEQQDRLILMGQRRGGFREGPGCRMEPPGDDDGPGPIRGGRFGGRGPRWSDEEED